MSLTRAIVVVSVLLVVWILASVFLPRKFALAVKAVLLVGVAGAVALQAALWSNSALRVAFDAVFNPVSAHDVLRAGGGSLPLPPMTSLRYRYSEAGAVYYTRLTSAQVKAFYDRLGGATTPGSQAGTSTVVYRGDEFQLWILPAGSGRGSDLRVEETASTNQRAAAPTASATAISTAHVFNRFIGRDQTLDGTSPGDAPEIAHIATMLQDVQWLTDNTIVKLPIPVPGGPPAITLTYTDGRTVAIQLAYRCQPGPPNCAGVPDTIMVGDRPARSTALVSYISNGSSTTQR